MARPAVQSGHLEYRHAQSHIRQSLLLRIHACAHSSFWHRRITLHCSIWPSFSMVSPCPILPKYLCDAQLEKCQKDVFFGIVCIWLCMLLNFGKYTFFIKGDVRDFSAPLRATLPVRFVGWLRSRLVRLLIVRVTWRPDATFLASTWKDFPAPSIIRIQKAF